MSKLIVVIGITGNQGGSVANAFLQDPQWKIRGITRNTASDAAKSLISRGVEMVSGDLDDVSSLKTAFQGANLIFSVTDFWQHFFNPANHATAAQRGISIGQLSYEAELRQGRNIADAAASVVDGLDTVGFIASTLSNARERSRGKFEELWHFDAKADVFPPYVNEKYPALAAKTSYLQTGVFMSSWRYSPETFFGKQVQNDSNDDVVYEMTFSAPPDATLPHLDVRKDTGVFVKEGLLKLKVGSVIMAAGTWCSWSDYVQTWSKATGRKAIYRQITTAELDQMIPGGFGKEIGDMWEYSADPGYDGGTDAGVLSFEDLQKLGITFPVTKLEEYMRKEDYTTVFEQGKE